MEDMGTRDGAADEAARMLEQALNRYERTLGDAALRAFLTSHGGLPGAKADLGLASDFAESVSERAAAGSSDWWRLCREFALMPATRAPTDDPAEFLCICGTLAGAAIASLIDDHVGEGLAILRRQAHDPRWRLRDATVMALTRLLLARRTQTLAALAAWMNTASPLHMRAAVKALTEPAVLGSHEVADAAVDAHTMAIDQILRAERPLTPAWRTLRIALGHSLAALALARPDATLALLDRLAEANDPDARRIVDQNLSDPRLQRLYRQRAAQQQG